MRTVVRYAVAAAAILASFAIVAVQPRVFGAPSLQDFLLLMILPLVAALSLAPRTIRFVFIAGAIYAALAGARRIWAPEGNITAVQQLSTAAMSAFVLPIAAKMLNWIQGR